jgi:hypothetical protein
MRRPRFGSVLAAVAVATAGLIPIFAAPAGATNNCGPGGTVISAVGGSNFPVGPGALATLKVDCHVDAGVIADNIALHDSPNAIWHHGGARTVAITPTSSSTAIAYASGAITATDIGRPINFTCQTGGAFIVTAGATSGTVSKANKTGCVATTANIDYTTNRLLQDISACSGTTLTGTANDKFAASDIGKSVSGGPFGGAGGSPAGVWRITAVNTPVVNTATLNAAAPAACANPDNIQLGAQTYTSTGVAVWANNPMTVELSNSSTTVPLPSPWGGQGFTCTGSALGLAGLAAGTIPAFSAAWTNMKVTVRGTTTVVTKVIGFSSPNLTLGATCPAGITATNGSATIGEPSANAPANSAPMMTLNAELNLNPNLVKTQDDCSRNSIEGFEVVGGWKNPGAYVAGTVPVPVSVGQIVFPTAVVTFAGNIVPHKGATNNGDAQVASQHFDFVFPSLPTSAAVCLNGTGTPLNATQLALGFNSTTLSGTGLAGAAPFLQTGAGNASDPTVRALDARTGAFHGRYEIQNGATDIAGSPGNMFSCTVPAATVAPGTPCGDG